MPALLLDCQEGHSGGLQQVVVPEVAVVTVVVSGG